jgi:hypothetical protein
MTAVMDFMPEKIMFSAGYSFLRHECAMANLGINTLSPGGCQLFWTFFIQGTKSRC